MKTWRDYRRTLKQWLSTTDVPSEKHGMLLWRALTGDVKLLISHFRDEDLLHWDAGQRIFEVLSQAHKHISEFEDQDDFDNAFYKLHRERNQTLLQYANVARAAYLKHDAYGHPLPDRTKGMIFLRQAKIPGHLEDHIVAKTNGPRNSSDLLDAIQILARRPMSQISSSFPSYSDEWDDSTNATEYYDIDDHDDVDNDEYYDEYNEPEDHDNDWIDMSGIPEDATFEEPELRRAGAKVSPVMSGNFPPRRLARVVVSTEAGETSRLMERTKGVVAHSWLRWMIFSLAPVV